MPSYEANFHTVTQSLAMHTERFPERLQRIQEELRFAKRLADTYPDRAADWQELVLEAGQLVNAGLQQGNCDIETLTADAEAVLVPMTEVAKSYSLLCVGHAHIDMNWQWSWPETVALTHDTFQTMLMLMEAFPEFIFSQSQASVYALIEKHNPRMFEEIQRRVQEGRWEVTASQWVEGDTNMANGESISRHLLYTREYFRDKFGLAPEDVRIDFEPDTFGHPATLPTILTRGGVRYYYHCRGSRGPHLYWWVGPDGSRLLVLNDVQWYMHFDRERTQIRVAPNMADPLMDFSQATGLHEMPVLYGVGDHGGGPTRRDIRRMLEMDRWPIYPQVKFSKLQTFFEIAEAEAIDLPEITGERNFIFAGCYTSQARQKEANRHGENLMYAAEAAAALGARITDVPYPQENLEEAWRKILFDQFHDILPGSGVRATRHFALGHAQETQAAAGMARTLALRALSRRVNTEALREGFVTGDTLRDYKDEREAGVALGAGVGNATATGGESAFSVTQTSDRAYVIFNPLAHDRTEIVRVKLWDTQLDPDHLVVAGEGVEPQPVQVMGTGTYAGHRYLEVAFPVALPALGYRAVCVSDRRIELGLPAPEDPSGWSGMGGAGRLRDPLDVTLENEFYKLRLDAPSGSIVSLVDKQTGREWVAPGEHLGLLELCLEANAGMTSWVIGQFKQQEALLQGGQLSKVHDGPFVKTLRWTRRVGSTALELDITLSQGVPRIDFQLRVDWREVGDRERGIPNLRVRFPMDISDPTARYEIPFGSIRRDLFEGQEVPAQRWADLSESDGQGMTLVNTSKYGFSVDDTTLTMTLLRASMDPDPLPDLGEHVIEYALVPHGAGWAEGDMMREGENLNIPPVVVSAAFHEGELPLVHTFVSVVPDNVRLVAVKQAQEGQGIILRLIEVEGKSTPAKVKLAQSLTGAGATAQSVDILERPIDGDAELSDGVLSVTVPAFGISTVRIQA